MFVPYPNSIGTETNLIKGWVSFQVLNSANLGDGFCLREFSEGKLLNPRPYLRGNS